MMEGRLANFTIVFIILTITNNHICQTTTFIESKVTYIRSFANNRRSHIAVCKCPVADTCHFITNSYRLDIGSTECFFANFGHIVFFTTIFNIIRNHYFARIAINSGISNHSSCRAGKSIP